MQVLQVQNVKKSLSKREIIKGISFDVEEGEIFGFLGPNGAGKTTTIRMLVGFITPNEGSIQIMGHDIRKEREKALSYVGAVVENPELYTYLSGRENLMQIARVRNIEKAYLEEIVELVELSTRIDDKVRKYSLGMKQRLGLAASLICKPKLLILDEPTNGLDPTGIIDFRRIVKKVAKETGAAVFISSHILSEVQMVCDKVAFIDQGIIKSVEMIHQDGVKETHETVVLVSKEKEKCQSVLKTLKDISQFTYRNNAFYLTVEKDATPNIIFALAQNNIPIEEIYKKQIVLEERYLELVQGSKKGEEKCS